MTECVHALGFRLLVIICQLYACLSITTVVLQIKLALGMLEIVKKTTLKLYVTYNQVIHIKLQFLYLAKTKISLKKL